MSLLAPDRSPAPSDAAARPPLAVAARAARGVGRRLRGVLGRGPLGPGEALLIERCAAVHTFGVSGGLDLVFVDARGRAVRVVESLPPRRLAWARGAEAVLELPAGAVRAAGGVEPGEDLAPRVAWEAGAEGRLAPEAGADPEAEARRERLLHAAALLAVVGAGAALRLAHPGADPLPLPGHSHAEVMDGPRYLHGVVDALHGRALDPSDADARRWPIHQALAGLGFRLTGGAPSLAGAHLGAALAGAGLPLAGYAAARAAWDPRTGLVAATLLAASYPLVAYGRLPLVYGPLATGLAAALALSAAGSSAIVRGRLRAGIALVAAAALAAATVAWGVKEVALLALPAVALSAAVALEARPARMLLGAALGLGGATLLCAPDGAPLRPLLDRWLAYAGGAGPASLAWSALRGVVDSGFVLLAAPMLLLALLGARAAADPLEERAARATAAACALLAALLLLSAATVARGDHGSDVAPLRRLAPALAPLALLAAAATRRMPASIAALVVAVALAPDALRLADALARPAYTCRAAAAVTARLLGPGAVVAGNVAHAVTLEAPQVARRLGPTDALLDPAATRALGVTHLAQDIPGRGLEVEERWRALGTPLVRLGHAALGRDIFLLWRTPFAEALGYAPTAQERAAEARAAASLRAPAPTPPAPSPSRSPSSRRRGGPGRASRPRGRDRSGDRTSRAAHLRGRLRAIASVRKQRSCT